MDERHWWIATKIQESFHIGGFNDNPTLLEDFLCEPRTLELINQFLGQGGLNKLFFYSDRPQTSALQPSGLQSTRQLHVVDSLANLNDVNIEETTCLYFLRHSVEKEVDPVRMEKDIFCGELRHSVLDNLNTLLSDIFLPLLKAQKDWGLCSEENKNQCLNNLERYAAALSETVNVPSSARQQVLRRPDNIVSQEFSKHRTTSYDQGIVSEYEALVTEWISTIDNALADGGDERFMDPTSGPLNELERWRRRQRMLSSIIEQLKGKECKTVIGVLITSKSKIIKKWKAIDASITDAANETKDKVKYLEALRRHFELLYHGATPISIVNGALPGLMSSVKQMDSISRFYARKGYLGLLFTKITNQLVNSCKEFILSETQGPGQDDLLWPKFYSEIETRILSTDPQGKSRAVKKRGKEVMPEDDTLLGRMKACITLYNTYKDMVRTLRDGLGGAHNLTHFPSISSLGAPSSRPQRGVLSRAGLSHGKSSKTPSVAGDSEQGHGVAFNDEESIFGHLDSFCSRIRQVIDAVYTLVQYGKLARNAEGLPRPRKEDLLVDDDASDELMELSGPGGSVASDSLDIPKSVSPTKTATMTHQGVLEGIVEEEEGVSTRADSPPDDPTMSEAMSNADEINEMNNNGTGLTAQNAALLRKLYKVDDADDDGPSVRSIVIDHTQTMKKLLEGNITTAIMLDVEGREKDKFNEAYEEFLTTVQQIELYLSAYLQAVFVRKMKTHEGLDVLTRFIPVMHRYGMKRTVSEKYIDIFKWYETDLEEVKELYEKNKEDPPMVRNAPPVSGAVHWSRQLLERIEEPMKVFRENRAVVHLRDFARIVKFYNRVATALVTFESLWLQQWKGCIEQAKLGLRATLLVVHPNTGEVVVNADDRVLQLVQECRWMKRLDIEIPESALAVAKQEQRFKSYMNHLELCLKEFKDICFKIREPVHGLFQTHTRAVLVALQPGLSSLAWNSMNIDAFLHQVHTANAKLRSTVDQVNHVIDTKIDSKLKKISELFLFDVEKSFERSWPPDMFTEAMLDSIGDQSETLFAYVNDIKTACHQLLNILLGQGKQPSIAGTKSLSASSKQRLSAKHLQVFPSPRSEEGLTDVTADDVMVADLLYFYSDLVYQSILSAICRSLITLAEAAGCDSVLETIAEDLETHKTSPATTPYTMSPESSPYYGRSRASTGRTRTSRPDSSMSYLSDMTWTLNKDREYTHLRFEVAVKFAIPKIIIEPTLDAVKTSLGQIAQVILNVADKVTWWAGEGVGETMLADITDELMVQSSLRQLDGVVEDLQRDIDKHLFHFRFYDFLWKDDMYGTYYDFIANDPGTFAIKREVERLLHIEDKIQGIPKILPIGPISLETRPITDALYGFAMQWKAQYAQVLHEEGKRQLDNAINYRSSIKTRLLADVVTLDQLNGTLNLLEEVRDMENKIDAIYLPIETMYADLISYRLRLPRSEVEEVEKLRDNWQEVVDLAEKCRIKLLKERRGAFEQELDKQVKLFVVEVIQFRNSFDSQGPAVPGVQPAEAVARLHEFQEIFKLYDSKRRTLDSVSRLFGIICKPFPELDKTGEELDLLGLLYGLFQKFIAFDNQFRDRLWADADLPKANKEVEQYWDECQSLPDKIKDWDAYNNMKNSIKFYLDVFPILHKLASKEIRNRHWLQVMGVTGSSFQLEANVFKLCHILDIGLIPHQTEIEEICHCASKELELEVKLRITEEEWTEQVLTFTEYKRRGPIFLEKDSMEHLLEQLENAQAILANMLTSRFVGPLREEAAGWAEKLRGVGEVLEQWLEVQDLWQYLEAVFSIPRTAKELPQEAKRFNRIDKSWSKIQRRAYDTRNVLQCTYGGEVPKGVVLRHIHEELEICFKSLTGYLDKKRQVFPRFYFLSDPVLLAVLSRPFDLESVKPHIRCIFNYVYDIRLERIQLTTAQAQRSVAPSPEKGILHSPTKELHASPTRSGSGLGLTGIQSRLSVDSRMGAATGMEGGVQDGTEGGLMQAIAVTSKEGELLSLDQEVPIKDGVEVWLKGLKESITKTMSSTVSNMIKDMENSLAVEELAYKYPTQVASLGLNIYWTKECELGIMEIRNDRKAIPNTAKKFVTTMSRLTQVLTKGTWKATEEHVTPLHRWRLESMVAQSYYLRDILDNMGNRKLRELTDFEWRRCIRVYPKQRSDGSHEPQMTILEERHPYGNEFFGGQSSLVVTPITERCFLTMAMCLNQFRGSALTGGTGVGKTETVKGLAFFLGRYLALFGCSPHTDPAALGKVVQGLAMDGSWGCFDEFQLLHKEAVAMVLDHVHAVISALQARKKMAILGDGEEVTLGRNIALFITVNSETGLHGDIPTDIKLLFRTVSLVVPDMSLILKARCAAYGFRSPKVLADRLKMVVQQCKDQLNPGDTELFNLKSMVTVLLHAVSSWRDVEGSKEYHQLFSIGSIAATVMFANMGRKLTKEERMELSRASSQGSLVQPGSSMPSAAMLKTVEKQPRKTGATNPMTPAAKAEHAVVAQALQDIVGPRLKPDALYLFNNVIKDVFSSVGDPPTPHSSRARRNKMSVENMVIDKAQENGLVASSTWVAKVMQLYAISQVNHGVIIAGGPGTGKSTCIQILVEALSAVNPAQSRQSRSSVSSITSISHKLQRISPLVVDDLSLMFGYLNQNHDWTDGVFTNVWKKANRNVSTTWLCLDGPLTPSWTDNFNTVLDSDRVLNLRNGDRLFLADNVKLLFETDSLSNASPASVARAGIVYLDREVLGWRPVAQAWLENRNQQEIHCLQKAFNKTMDAVVNYVLFETKPLATLTEVGTFKTCLGLLESMLNEHIEIGGELHIERLFLFCLIWTFGGLLEGSDRKGFSDLLRTLTSALPDYDHDISVFDYYVDESGEWDPWISKVPDVAYTDTRDLLGDVLVDTVDTIRTRVLLEFANLTNMHVMLLGPPGCGKTAMINDFINTLDSSNQITKRLVFSGASTASQLQQFIEANIHHRQGFVYGARDNKRFQLFIDDINLPPCDEHGVQRCNELMRQLLDERLLITLQKPFEWRTIEDLVVLSACTMNNYPSSSSRKIPDRLLRHFVLIHLPEPKEGALSSIVDAVLDGNMTKHNGQSLAQELQDAIVNASCKLLTSVQNVLRPTPMPGRYHYMFTLRDISKTFQCLMRLSEEARGEINMVASLWRHEVQRIMRDRLCRTSDINWFDKNLEEICKAEIPKGEEDEGIFEHFVTFPIEHRGYQRPVTSMSQKTVRVILQPVCNLEMVHKCILSHLTRYNEEFGNVTLNIMLSDDVIYHVIRMHRVLSFHHGGSMMLVGAIGSHLTTLVNLALHVADMPIHPMDTTKANTFFDGLRSAVRLSGTEGKMLTLMFTGRDLKEDVYLDAINSILICGEYPPLFSNDELDGLLQALTPAMKRHFPNVLVDPMKFFVSRVKTNLHIILCLPPTHRLLKIAPSQYPGLLSGMQMNWVCDWSQSALLGEAGYYIQKHHLAKDSSVETRENLVTCMSTIHSFVLRDCNQIPWAGSVDEKIKLTTLKLHGKKEIVKVHTHKVDNLPYTKLIMKERIKQKHYHADSPGKQELFVGPRTFRRFMDCFRYIYNNKSKENTAKVGRLKKALNCLARTYSDCKNKRLDIRRLHTLYEEASKKTADLLQELTAKATILEKTKAQYTEASNSLSAFLHMNEVESDEEVEDQLLIDDERDEYDREFDRMREENLKSRKVAIEEDLATVRKKVDECRATLQKIHDQVMQWKEKVDRPCIERLKSFTNPPPIVLQVMEMVMALLGKNKPLGNQGERTLHLPSNEESSMISGRQSTSSSGGMKSPSKWKSRDTGSKSKGKDQASDKQRWKQITVLLQDSVKFVDMLHGVPWQNGLKHNILANVEYYLPSKSKDGDGVTGEGSLLDIPGGPKLPPSSRRSPSPGDGAPNITIAATRYSSEDAGNLVAYICAMVEYTHHCGPLQDLLKQVKELEEQQRETERLQKEKDERDAKEASREAEPAPEPEKEYTEADIPILQEEVTELQRQFDASVVEKHSLEIELSASNERLRAATNMIVSLQQEKERWQTYVDENADNEWLLSNCMTAAAFLTYCGGMTSDSRQRFGDYINQVCVDTGFPIPKRRVLKDVSLIQFLYTPVEIESLKTLKLPSTPNSQDNACFVMQEHSSTAWSLLCDPTSRILDWIKSYLNQQLVIIKYHELRAQLETCLTEGTPLLLMDCDVDKLAEDPRFYRLLRSRLAFINGKGNFKMMVADHEVECHPGFRLYLHTTCQPHCVPHALAAYTSVMYFYQTRDDCEEELLDRFMTLEKARLEEDRITALKERISNMKQLDQLEDQMLECLASDNRLLNDLTTTKKLGDMKKHYDETVESQERVQISESAIHNAREGYRSIARRGAVCFDVSRGMSEVNFIYQTSWQQFLETFDISIKHSERSAAVKAVVERLTFNAFQATARSLLERDRHIYSVFLAMEVEDSIGNVGFGEREYVISPQLGSATMSGLGLSAASDHRVCQIRKPFDWMLDDQFHNLQSLAINFEWFQDMFERMPKDGRETQWRTLGEHENPELHPLPEKMDDHYNPMQRLMVIRAFRPDRIMQAATVFVGKSLGKKYTNDVSIDPNVILRQTSPVIPILLLYTREGDVAEKIFQEFSAKKQVQGLVVNLSSAEHNEERRARKAIQHAMQEGTWVMLKSAHNATHLLNSLETLLQENDNKQGGESPFRVWISAQVSRSIPVRLLQYAVKVVIDTPKIVKESLLRAVSSFEPEQLKASSRSEWVPLLHNIAMVHAMIRLRGRYGLAGWNYPDVMDFSHNELTEALNIARMVFSDSPSENESLKGISWMGLRYILTEIIYGSYINDDYDRTNLSAMVDYWIGPNATKREFEATKLKFRIPPAFFSNFVRVSSLSQAIEGLPNHFLDVPEACGMHTSYETGADDQLFVTIDKIHETVLGDDQYVFTRLNQVLDAMPSTRTLSHVLQPRPATPFHGPSVASVNGTALQPNVASMGVYASASRSLIKSKRETEIWEICHNIISKIPKGWNRDYITERVRKIGGDTPFNRFVLREIDMMIRLIADLKATFNKLKVLCESPNETFGDQMSERLIDIAVDLFHHRIPSVWAEMCGDSAPPPNWTLAQWMSDLSQRCQHLERIIVQGKDKFPAYWLGAFFHPRALLALLKQDAIRAYGHNIAQSEPVVFQTEITARDKDHVRDPPQEGMFVYGVYVWGCSWEKTTGELQDSPPRHGATLLPIIHITTMPYSEKPAYNEQRTSEMYLCPVYPTRICARSPVFLLDVKHDNISASKWALRGLAATIRPY
ncbi:dynein heavy chain 8, axonemal-like [Lytechinus variegatus]|uniref:dynein heavy chain 8, axonemal-like n=1 Tax=Lytechinus variegatus TaxID=7654 RepID=UPI001BB173EC|nr:dynein heavy chain 8, axonemal-like [Lytechinus variegatus]